MGPGKYYYTVYNLYLDLFVYIPVSILSDFPLFSIFFDQLFYIEALTIHYLIYFKYCFDYIFIK